MKKTIALLVVSAMAAASVCAEAAQKPLPETSEPSLRSLSEGRQDQNGGIIVLKNEVWVLYHGATAPASRKEAEKLAKSVGAAVVAGKESAGYYLFRWPQRQDIPARVKQMEAKLKGGKKIRAIPSRYGAMPPAAPDECLSSTLQVRINDQLLHIGPLFKMGLDELPTAGPEKESPEASVCRTTKMGAEPFAAKYIRLYPGLLEASDVNKKFCSGTLTGWKKDLCDKTDAARAAKFPQSIIVFARGRYPEIPEAQPVEDQPYDSTYGHYQEEVSKNRGGSLRAEGHPAFTTFPLKTEGLVERIWVSEEASLKTPDNQPYAASCLNGAFVPKEATYTDDVSCWVTYPLNERLSVRYQINTTLDRLPQQARDVDAHVRAMVKEWLALPAEHETPSGKK